MNIATSKPTILLLGSTGQVGQLVFQKLENSQDVDVRVTSRRKEEVERLRSKGRDAVYLNLNDPKTFGPALAGAEWVLLLTGYTVEMLAQSKTFVDAAKKAAVEHIEHLGVYAESDCPNPHFTWLVKDFVAMDIARRQLHENVRNLQMPLLHFQRPSSSTMELQPRKNYPTRQNETGDPANTSI